MHSGSGAAIGQVDALNKTETVRDVAVTCKRKDAKRLDPFSCLASCTWMWTALTFYRLVLSFPSIVAESCAPALSVHRPAKFMEGRCDE